MKDGKSILGSVGEHGANFRADVVLVQTLLQAKGCNPGHADGSCGVKTIRAIRNFQRACLAKPDGLIEPGRITWQKLSADVVPAAPSADKSGDDPWGGDSSQWSQDKKLASMNPDLRSKVRGVITALASRGFKPKIFFGWRSVEVQLKLFNEGNSTVKFSFHNAQQPDGTPNAYAADIIDERYAWGDQAESSGFWKALGEEAKKQGLYWGGDWVSFRDWAHVQLVDNSKLAQVKKDSGL